MHELSLTQQIVRIVCDAAKQEHALRVLKVNLAVGEDSGIMPDCVQTYYDLLAKGTVAEGAILNATTVRTTLFCEACQKEFERARFSFSCPVCGAEGSHTGKGSDCFVESIELETEETPAP